MRLYDDLCWRLHLEFTLMNDNLSIHAQHLRPPLWLHCRIPSLHLLCLYGCIVLDNALLYLSAVVLRIHDTADN